MTKHIKMRPFLCEMYEPRKKPETRPKRRMRMMRKMMPPDGPSAIFSSKRPLMDKRHEKTLNMKRDEKSLRTRVKCFRPKISM